MLRDWVVRTTGDPLALAPAVREAIWSLDKDLPISRVQTMEQVHSMNIAPQRFRLLVIGLFALLSLMLATAGLYGVTSYSVALRSREIGIRMALGADRASVLSLVMREVSVMLLWGLTIGLLLALILTRSLAHLSYRVDITDPVAMATAAFVLASVALAAAAVPSVRALGISPSKALRYS